MLWLLLVAGVAVWVYFKSVKPFVYWKTKAIQQQSLLTLWIENIGRLLLPRPHSEKVQLLYNSFPEQRYAGMYRSFTPGLLLRDPDLIKQITVKDFDHFVDHNLPTGKSESLWSKNLFSMTGDDWRDMRATLSPSFTSSKMQAMFGLINECADHYISYFQTEDSKIVTVEMKDTFTRFANDVIASVAFGITCDSLRERDSEFYLMGKEATDNQSSGKKLALMLTLLFPKLAQLLGIKFFKTEVENFFRRLVKQNIQSREKSGIVRPDMIHLLMEARKGRLKHEDHLSTTEDLGFAVVEESAVGKEEKRQKRQLTDDDIAAQAFVFFVAGFETVSTLLCFAVHELALNPDVQKQLREEVDETLKKCGGGLTYEALMKMKYLDMVVSEVLRKWPPSVEVNHVCTKPYTIQPTKKEEKPVHISKGETVWLPIFGIHRDPQYYPDPDRFDPERFSDENKSNIYPYSFIPFGSGPRSCIGNRFALMETKTLLFHILANFKLVVVERTTLPLKLAGSHFGLRSENGFWFGLKPRTQNRVT